jgi:hypothetical protein
VVDEAHKLPDAARQWAFFQPMGCVGQQIIMVADLNIRLQEVCQGNWQEKESQR